MSSRAGRPPLLFRLEVVLVLHLALLATALVPGDALLSRPIVTVDYSCHFYSATDFAEHFANTFSFWGYDPRWMAGFPEGFVSLVDNKLLDLLVWLAPHHWEAAAFNAAVLLTVLCVPWVLHAAARQAGATAAEAGGAALAGAALTVGAPMTMVFWTGGGISFFLSSLLSVPAAFGLVRAVSESSLGSRRGVRSLALAMFCVFVHPFGLLPIAAALATTLLGGERPKRQILVDLVIIAALLALPLAPIAAGVLQNRGHTRLFTTLFRGGPGQFVRDWWTHLFRTDNLGFNGAGSLAAVALAALVGLARETGSQQTPPAVRRAILGSLALATGLAYTAAPLHPRLAALQPQRFLVVFGFFAAIPAGRGLTLVARGLSARRPADWIAAILVLALAGEGTWALRHARLVATGFDAAEEAMPAFLDEHAPDDGRVLVEAGMWPIPAARGSRRETLVRRFMLLPLAVDREFLGVTDLGLFTAQRYTRLDFRTFFGRRLAGLSADDLREILDRFAVSAVVGCSLPAMESLARFPEVLEPRGDVGGCRGFRVRDAQTSRFLEGEGTVRASLDRIEVHEARGERLVLKYHWMPTLVTEPPLPIEEAPQPGSPVGFIAVRPGGVRDFTIVQASWLGTLAGRAP